MRQRSPTLDCIIPSTANVNAAATAAIKTSIGVAADDDIADTKQIFASHSTTV